METLKNIYNKIKYYIKRLNRTIKYVHRKTGRLCVFIFFDIIWCIIFYGCTDNEYRIFEFYNIYSDLRKTYMTRRKYKRINRKLVDKNITSVLNNKETLLRRFKDYLKRNVYNTNDMSFKEFEEFAFLNKNIVARSKQGSFISTYKTYDLKDYRSQAFMKDKIDKDKLSLVEQLIPNHKILLPINDVVVINVVSVVNKGNVNIASSTIKFKDGNSVISGYVDVDSKKVIKSLRDNNGKKYSTDYDGVEIPVFDKIIKEVKELAMELDEIKQVEWSFIINNRGVVHFVDANVWDDYVFCQIPEYLEDRVGLMPYYKKIM